MLTPLSQLENRSIYVIREAYRHFPKMALLWSIGKDSTTLLWLTRKAFFGKLPFPVLHIDTGCKFPEIYKFREEYAKKWNLDLVVARNDEALAAGMGPNSSDKLACCSALKTDALRQAIARHKFQALLLGIRRDEHGIRAKERYFSPRDEQFQWDYRNQPLELWHQYQCPGGGRLPHPRPSAPALARSGRLVLCARGEDPHRAALFRQERAALSQHRLRPVLRPGPVHRRDSR